MSKKIVMNVPVGRPLMDVLGLCYKAQVPVLLIGTTGVGKSTILEQFSKINKIGFLSRDLSLMEPPDLVGMPTIVKGRTRFCAPDSLPTDGEGILVLEEVNRAPEYMRSPRRASRTSGMSGRLPVFWSTRNGSPLRRD